MKWWAKREYLDFHDLPAAEWSWRERFYVWCFEHPWWQCGRGSSDGVFFASAYGDELWRKIFIKPIYRAGCVFEATRRWVRARTGRGMHVVRTELPPSTYYDPDTQILYAVMACNDRYVGDGEGIISVEQEFIDVAYWWNVSKKVDEARQEWLLNECYGEGRSGYYTQPVPDNDRLMEIKFAKRSAEWNFLNDEFRALEKKIRADETEMLLRIMKIRDHMWI